jgi:hypothetical protein
LASERKARAVDRDDALHAALLQAGENAPALKALLADLAPEDVHLRSVLRRSVPVRFLEMLGTQPPWCDRPLVAAGVVLNPRTPRHVAQRLVPSLYWMDLAEVAASARLLPAVRHRAETELRQIAPDLRPGDRITLGRLATAGLLRELLRDEDPRVLKACLDNPRLREDDLLAALRAPDARRELLELSATAFRWRERYAVRTTLVRQPRTPLAVVLGQLSSLLPADLRLLAADETLPTLVQVAAERLLQGERGGTE